MRKLILLCCFFSVAEFGFTQSVANPYPKTITVTGSAEMEIIPDEIYVNVVLREYQKKGESKKELEQIKTDFLQVCRSVGIPDSAISISAYTGYNSYYFLQRKRKKDPDLFAAITYQVRFSSSKQMDELVKGLDDEATQGFDIARTSHSKMTAYRKKLKIDAVKAAKDKAVYLTEAIDEKIAGAITIKEPEEPTIVSTRGSNLYSNGYVRSKSVEDSFDIDFKKVKLRFEVTVVFALQ